MIRAMRIVLGAGLILCVANQTSALLSINGDFSSGLSGWMTTGPVSDGGGFALLSEDPVISVTSLEQQIVIPAGATSLSFEYGLSSTPDQTSGFPLPDGLAAYLLDPLTFDPLISSPGFPDYFYEDRSSIQNFDPGIVSLIGNRVTLDLATIAATDTDALITFDLLGGDDGYATQVTIDNVIVSTNSDVIPEPVTLISVPVAVGTIGIYLRRRRGV